MYTDSQLARAVESRDDALLAEREDAASREELRTERIASLSERLARRMTKRPMSEELAQAMSNVLVEDVFPMCCAWWMSDVELGAKTREVLSAELTKIAHDTAEAEVDKEIREIGAVPRRVRLGDEL